MYFGDVIYDLCRILHYVHDQIHKGRVIVLDQAGILPGDDNFEICLLFDLSEDPECQIIFDDPAGDDFPLVDTDRSVLRDI